MITFPCCVFVPDNNRQYAGECGAVEAVLDCISRFAYSDGKPLVYQEAFAAITNMCCNTGEVEFQSTCSNKYRTSAVLL